MAGVAGVLAAGTVYSSVAILATGRTPGQALIRLRVVDAATGIRPPPERVVARSLLVVGEVVAAPTVILAAPAVTELVVAAVTGTGLTDRITGTRVVLG